MIEKMTTNSNYNRRKCLIMFVMALLLLLATGCAGMQTSRWHKEQAVAEITQLQRKMDQFLDFLEQNIGTEAASYASNRKFYEDIKSAVIAIRASHAGLPEKAHIDHQLALLRLIVINLESTHEFGIRKDDIPLIRESFDNSCMSIIRLEMTSR